MHYILLFLLIKVRTPLDNRIDIFPPLGHSPIPLTVPRSGALHFAKRGYIGPRKLIKRYEKNMSNFQTFVPNDKIAKFLCRIEVSIESPVDLKKSVPFDLFPEFTI